MELDKYIEEVDDVLDEVFPILEHYRQDNRTNGLLWIQVGDLIRRLDVLYRTVPENDEVEALKEENENLKDDVHGLRDTISGYTRAIDEIQEIIDGI